MSNSKSLTAAQYITEQLEFLDRFIYHHQCNIPEPNFQEQSEYHQAWGERQALQKVRDLLGVVRDRKEIEERLAGLVRFLAWADPADDSVARAHARRWPTRRDLVWVLYPALGLTEQIDYLAGLIAAQENPDASQEQTAGHP